MIWFVIGAVLGALQLSVSRRGSRWREENAAVFVGVGALVGAAVYGTVLWLVFQLWLEVT